jgi:hypothetical protein
MIPISASRRSKARNIASRCVWLSLFALAFSLFTGCDRDSNGESEEESGDSSQVADSTAEEDPEVPVFTGEVERLLRMEGVAGYEKPSMAEFGDACLAGQVPTEPQHSFIVEEPTSFEFLARGEDDDISLVIDGPGGPYCNDDYDGLDAGMQLELEPGDYSVFVGTYSDQPIDPTPNYTFVIKDPSESEPRHPVLTLLDARLDELIQTAGPAQKEQFERLRVIVNSLDQPRGSALKIESVDRLKRLFANMNVTEAEQEELDALIQRLEDESNEEKSRDASGTDSGGSE